MKENVSGFISFHNANILDQSLIANFSNVSDFAAQKHISLEDLSIEKHRLTLLSPLHDPFLQFTASSLRATQGKVS